MQNKKFIEAVLENQRSFQKIRGHFQTFFDLCSVGYQKMRNQICLRMYNNHEGLDHQEATRGRLRNQRLFLKNIIYYTAWVIERCEIKNVLKCTINFGGFDHLEATRGRLRNQRPFLKAYLILKCGVSKSEKQVWNLLNDKNSLPQEKKFGRKVDNSDIFRCFKKY